MDSETNQPPVELDVTKARNLMHKFSSIRSAEDEIERLEEEIADLRARLEAINASMEAARYANHTEHIAFLQGDAVRAALNIYKPWKEEPRG